MTEEEKMGLKVLKEEIKREKIMVFVFSQKAQCGVGRGY